MIWFVHIWTDWNKKVGVASNNSPFDFYTKNLNFSFPDPSTNETNDFWQEYLARSEIEINFLLDSKIIDATFFNKLSKTEQNHVRVAIAKLISFRFATGVYVSEEGGTAGGISATFKTKYSTESVPKDVIEELASLSFFQPNLFVNLYPGAGGGMLKTGGITLNEAKVLFMELFLTNHKTAIMDVAQKVVDSDVFQKYIEAHPDFAAKIGPPGPPGADSTVPGPAGADSTVPGPAGANSTVPGPAGADSTVPGPAGADSTVPGPAGANSTVPGPAGADSTVPGPAGADSTVPGPAGKPADLSVLNIERNYHILKYDETIKITVPLGCSNFTLKFCLTGATDTINPDDGGPTFNIHPQELFFKFNNAQWGHKHLFEDYLETYDEWDCYVKIDQLNKIREYIFRPKQGVGNPIHWRKLAFDKAMGTDPKMFIIPENPFFIKNIKVALIGKKNFPIPNDFAKLVFKKTATDIYYDEHELKIKNLDQKIDDFEIKDGTISKSKLNDFLVNKLKLDALLTLNSIELLAQYQGANSQNPTEGTWAILYRSNFFRDRPIDHFIYPQRETISLNFKDPLAGGQYWMETLFINDVNATIKIINQNSQQDEVIGDYVYYYEGYDDKAKKRFSSASKGGVPMLARMTNFGENRTLAKIVNNGKFVKIESKTVNEKSHSNRETYEVISHIEAQNDENALGLELELEFTDYRNRTKPNLKIGSFIYFATLAHA